MFKQDPEIAKRKTHMMKAFMNHAGTAKTIQTALKAPVGSTKRSYAKNVVSIMKKLHPYHDDGMQGYNDGMGGPGIQWQREMTSANGPEFDVQHIPTDGPKGMVIFPKIPKPVIKPRHWTAENTGSASKDHFRPAQFDGQGGPGTTDWSAPSPQTGFLQPANSTGANMVQQGQQNVHAAGQALGNAATAVGGALGSAASGVGSFISGMFTPPNQSIAPPATTPPNWNNLLHPQGVQTQVPGNYQGPYVAPTQNPAPQAPAAAPNQSVFPAGTIPGQSTASNQSTDPPQSGSTGQQYGSGGGAVLGGLVNQALNGNQQQGGASISPGGSTGTSGAAPTQTTTSHTIPTPDQLYTSANSPAGGALGMNSFLSSMSGAANTADKNGLGAGMFALGAMSDPNNPFTKGLSLQQMSDQSAKELDQKYGVTSLQQNLAQMRSEGAGNAQMFTNYIAGRDQYLNDIERTQEKFMSDLGKYNLANPADMATVNNYNTYLDTLKGAQQQRYINVYNGAINEYNGQLQAVQNNYTDAVNAYNTEIARDDKITADQYNMYTAALTDMYNTVDQAPLKAQQLMYAKLQNQKLQADIVADAAKAAQSPAYLTDYGKAAGKVIIDNKGFLMGSDQGLQYDMANAASNGIDAVNAATMYTQGVMNVLAATSGQTKDGQGNKINGSTKQVVANNALKQYAALYAAGYNAKDQNTMDLATNSLNQISQKLASEEMSPLVSGMNNVRNQIANLSQGTGAFGMGAMFGSTKMKSKSDFVSEFTKNVTGATAPMASSVYDYVATYAKNNGETLQDAINSLLTDNTSTTNRGAPADDSTLAQHLINIYSGYLQTNAASSLSDPSSSMMDPVPYDTTPDTGITVLSQ